MINYHAPLLVEGKQDLWHNLDKFRGSSEIGSIDDLYLIHLVQPEMADNGVRDARHSLPELELFTNTVPGEVALI